MIPELDENGNLPPGIHWAEWEEFPVGDYDLDSFEFFQRDRLKNKKGIIAIDLIRWEP